MSNIKTSIEIYQSMVDFLKKSQDKVTDFSVTSALSGILYGISTEIEKTYEEAREVRKQAFLKTATGRNVDLHIQGTFGLVRGGDSRASGYVVFYANAPILNTENTRIWCAKYDRVNDSFEGLERAHRVVSSGSDNIGGRVFVVTAPLNLDYVKYDEFEKAYYIDLKDTTPQFIILPVVATLKGETANLPENSINIISNPIIGINGVINTYNPVEYFFRSSGVVNVQAPIMAIDFNTSKLTLTKTSGFKDYSLMHIESAITGNTLNAIYTADDGTSITRPVELSYSDVFSNYITIDDIDTVPSIVVVDRFNTPKTYVLDKVIRDNQVIDNFGDFKTFLAGLINSNPAIYAAKAIEAQVDKAIFLDPDLVLDEDGIILTNARIGGGSEADSDEVYKTKLTNYLSSLGRGTPSALETGALTVSGITFAKVLPKHLSPRGTSTIMISGVGGIVTAAQMNEVRTTLDSSWKSSGEGLIIKTPDRVELTVIVKTSIFSGYSEDLITSNIREVVRRYISDLTPGQSIDNNNLIALLKSIEGVRAIRNVYIGKVLTESTYNYSNTVSRDYFDTLGSINGYSLNLLNRLYSTNQPILVSENLRQAEVPSFVSLNTDKKLIVRRMTRNALNAKVIEEVTDRATLTPFLSFMTNWHSIGSLEVSPNNVTNLPDYTAFRNIFRNNNPFSTSALPLIRQAFGDNYMYELTRYMTEPLASNKRSSIILPISFDTLRVSDTEPYNLSLYEIPVVGTFNNGSEIVELIGVEYV